MNDIDILALILLAEAVLMFPSGAYIVRTYRQARREAQPIPFLLRVIVLLCLAIIACSLPIAGVLVAYFLDSRVQGGALVVAIGCGMLMLTPTIIALAFWTIRRRG